MLVATSEFDPVQTKQILYDLKEVGLTRNDYEWYAAENRIVWVFPNDSLRFKIVLILPNHEVIDGENTSFEYESTAMH